MSDDVTTSDVEVTAPSDAARRETVSAFIKAQGEMTRAPKKASNPHLKSKYADLASVWEAAYPAFHANGFGISQPPVPPQVPGACAVKTKLLHISGGTISATLELPLAQQTPQGFGSALTYARRYGLATLTGVITEDDDGHAASNRDAKAPPTSLKAAMKERQAAPVPAPSAALVTDAGGKLLWPPAYLGKSLRRLNDVALDWCIDAAGKEAAKSSDPAWAERIMTFTDEKARRALGVTQETAQ